MAPDPSRVERPGADLAAEERRILSAYDRRARAVDGRYSWFDPGHLFIMQERERAALRLLRRCGIASLEDKRILDLGCGTGYWIRLLTEWGARPGDIVGIDLREESLRKARALCAPGVSFRCESAARLDTAGDRFDLIVQSTLFSSVLDGTMRREIARRMQDILAPDGLILWYDFFVDNPRNPDVRGVTRREIRELFAGCDIRLRRTTLAPPIARPLARRSWTLCTLLGTVPLLRTHYIGAIRPAGSGA